MKKKVKRLSAYQKLKKKNEELVQDIYNIVMEEDIWKTYGSKMKWTLKFNLEKQIWFGDATKRNM